MDHLLYKRVKRDLIAMIARLEPHKRLPSRPDLAVRFQVTRTTIDRAISELIGEGLLYSRDGSGTYVAEQQTSANAGSSGEKAESDTPRRDRIESWGVLLPNIMHDTYPGILRGIQDQADRHGVNVIVCNTDNIGERQTSSIRKLADSGVSGIVVVPALQGELDRQPFDELRERRIPLVFCNRGFEGVSAPRVVSNNFYGAYIAVKHLLSVGYRRIAYLSRPMYSVALERFQGYTSALTEAGVEVEESLIRYESSFDATDPGYQEALSVLQLTNRPDAIFCFNDAIAHSVYKAAAELGLRPGVELGVIGYDNTSICERLDVRLSSVKFQTYEIGARAAELLIQLQSGEPVPPGKMIVLQPELVIRASCPGPRTHY
ncbi:GntR family transcriptional regulator [Paenibacillus koleovorans]|uniref:GntR family transcriptional regulator n=1 Tax=Paenibacillus koleovorans TaxID=121608 RepID=UPI000FD8582D|nr:GntR family transcriptional regulator [Paenibacillus koleovorans]